MILTGAAIEEGVRTGDIEISPFDPAQVNPNSYNYRLSPTLKVAVQGNGADAGEFEKIELPVEGQVFEAGTFILATTAETIGSRRYAMSLIGRSSIGRLGLFLQLSANLGHVGSAHRWTLELYFARRLRLYPHMKIGQVSFWNSVGSLTNSTIAPKERYAAFNEPQECLEVFGSLE